MSEVLRFRGARGTDLTYRQMGAGRPLILLHGYFSNAEVNWLKYGHAAALAAAGHLLVLPDLRGHGDSAKSHDPADYPPDVLAEDGLALLSHLGLDPGDPKAYDLGGYSLGARTTIRMMVRGARPGRAVLAGMGLSGLTAATVRSAHFRDVLTNLGSHPPRSAAWMAEAFLRTTGGDPTALLLLLDSFVDTSSAELAAITVPTAVVLGSEDDDNGSGPELAAALGSGLSISVPGNHMSAVTKPELAAAFVGFLAP
ncbi:MAG TPA: alpha/beta hydrolase [Sporichthyaceae bacterium]|jgi:pimeloyl-ACP methyl ester carboxylesterase|nr:alpha/beta hydrolase [Sporichthyaceae bacterium]